jgi:hypothetical protein
MNRGELHRGLAGVGVTAYKGELVREVLGWFDKYPGRVKDKR